MNLVFFILLAAGIFMICLEVFLPGGVIGSLGAIALIGAVIIGFLEFGQATGMYILIAILILLSACIIIWIKYFPKTVVGKTMMLQADGREFKSSGDQFKELVGKEAETLTDLRPAGIVQMDGKRYDVISEGGMVDRGKRVRVVKTSGRRIIVRRINAGE